MRERVIGGLGAVAAALLVAGCAGAPQPGEGTEAARSRRA